MPNKLDVNTKKLPTDAELRRMFDAVPILIRHGVADQVVRAGSQPVVKRARQLSPRSSNTGTADKRSRQQRLEANWEIPLWKTIKRVVRKYSANATAIIGPEWPEGNKAYFNTSPKGRKQWFWGRFTGRTVAQIRNWIVQALDETRSQQLAAMKAKLRQKMDEIWKQRA